MGDKQQGHLGQLPVEATGLEFDPQHVRAVLDALPVVVWAVSSDGIITLSEGRGLLGLGVKPGQLVGSSVYDVYRDFPDAMNAIRRGLAGEEFSMDTEVADRVWENRYIPRRAADGRVMALMGLSFDVTATRRAQNELERSEERWRSLVENAPNFILLIDCDRKVQFINRALPGYDKSGIIGRPLSDFTDPRFHQVQTQSIDAVMAGAPTAHYESVGTDDVGCEHWFDTNIGPIYQDDEVVSLTIIAKEITEQKKAAADLRDSEQRFRGLIEQTPMGTAIYNPDGTPIFANAAHARILGLDDADIAHYLETYNILEDQQLKRAGILPLIKKGFAGESITLPPTLYTARPADKDSARRWLQGTIFSVKSDRGEIREIVVALEDITAQAQLEDEKKELEEQMRHRQKLESLGVLAGGIAHDFNNILVGILGHADLVASKIGDDSEQLEHVQEIVHGAKQAADLCRQMLAYSGRGQLTTRPIDLSELVADIAGLLDVAIAKGTKVEYDFAKGLPAVEVDVTQLRQVAMNLITNASDAIGDSGGRIHVRSGLLRRDDLGDRKAYFGSELSAESYVYFEVDDNGGGMDRETQMKLFDPFFTTKQAGRGLGLAAVLGIVRGHGGGVRVRSQVGKGTSFRIVIPTSTARPQPLDAGDNKAVARTRGGTVLVVDDDDRVRKLACHLLVSQGYAVVGAASGEDAITAYRERGTDIDVVLLDMTMPGMSGTQTLSALRTIDPMVAVILTSGYSDQDAATLSSAGFSTFLPKPYRPADLFEVIAQTLSTRD